jgi:hypothetical protein
MSRAFLTKNIAIKTMDDLDTKDERDENVDPLKTPIVDPDEEEVGVVAADPLLVDPLGDNTVSIDDLIDEEEDDEEIVDDDLEADEM